MEEIISLLREITAIVASGDFGGGGGGLVEPGTPDNITIIGSDGTTIVDSGYSKLILETIQNLTPQDLIDLGNLQSDINLIRKWAGLLSINTINEWNSETLYQPGDYVIKDNELYKYTQASLGTWNAAVVEPTYIIKQIAEIIDGSEKEKVILEFASEDNGASFAGQMVTVTVDGQEAVNYSIAANSTVTFEVTKGTNYTVDLPTIAGYVAPTQRRFNAIFTTRTLTVTYLRLDDSLQLVRIRSIFTTSGNNTTTTPGTGNITLEIQPWNQTTNTYDATETKTLTLTNGVCSTFIPVGSLYTVKFPDHFSNGYINPKNQSFEASKETNFIVGRYLKNVSEIHIVDSKGNYMPYAEWDYSSWDGEEEMYLYYNTVTLLGLSSTNPVKENCSFLMPLMNFIKGNSFPGTMKNSWGNYGITMLSGTLTYDGYTNTHELIVEAAGRGTTANAALQCSQSTIQIGNETPQTMTGFLGAKEQWGTIGSNWEVLNYAVNAFRRTLNSKAGSIVYAETSSNLLTQNLVFWTSTLNSATGAWYMVSGSLTNSNYYGSKTISYICLPFYAF